MDVSTQIPGMVKKAGRILNLLVHVSTSLTLYLRTRRWGSEFLEGVRTLGAPV